MELTEHQGILERLQASELRYRKMLEVLPSGVLVHANERVVLANRAAVQLFGGHSEADMLGRCILEHIDSEFHPAVHQRVQRVYNRGDLMPAIEVVFLRLDGTPFWGEASAGPIEHEGKPASMVVIRDISARKKAEFDRAQLEAQLVQSQKLEAVGRLAGGIAHDFNNLLTEIAGQSELAMMDLSPDHPHYSMLQAVGDAAQRASALTRQLLAFSRKQVMLQRVIPLNDIVSSLERMLRRLIGKDVQFQVALSPSAGCVSVDPGQLEQVLLNLCINARDAMPSGGKLLISTGVEVLDDDRAASLSLDAGGSYCVLSVVDTGCGMTPEVLAHLFEPFFTTKPKELGTGLGLSTSYGIVRQHQGSIDVRSRPGKGTVFRVLLPQTDDTPGAAHSLAKEEPLRGGGETVLCVEDEPLVREVTVTMLRRLGYRVLVAESPLRALELTRAHSGPLHLLVTDLIMPRMNGRELAERLRSERSGLSVLYTSGYTEDVIAHQGLLAPDVHFLGKPFTLRALAAAVRSALDSAVHCRA